MDNVFVLDRILEKPQPCSSVYSGDILSSLILPSHCSVVTSCGKKRELIDFNVKCRM